jgi:hypothetical protein
MAANKEAGKCGLEQKRNKNLIEQLLFCSLRVRLVLTIRAGILKGTRYGCADSRTETPLDRRGNGNGARGNHEQQQKTRPGEEQGAGCRDGAD